MPKNTQTFKDAGELKFNLGYKTVILTDVEKTRKVCVNDNEIALTYASTQVCDPEDISFTKFNRGFDEYSGENNGETINVKYRNDTGELCFYSLYRDTQETIPIYSENEYKSFAIEELNRRLPNEWQEVYSKSSYEFDDSSRRISVIFSRPELFGCDFYEFIVVRLEYDGSISCFDARMYGLFDEVISNLNQKQIDSAYNAVKTQLISKDSKSTLSSPLLFIDKNGVLYMGLTYNEADINSSNDECNHNALVYVNVG